MVLTREQLLAPFNMSAEQLHGWEPVPLIVQGKHAGTLIVKGMEVHFAFTERPKVCVRRAGREMLAPVLERFGMLTTKVPKGLVVSERFIERIGFKETWQDAEHTYYMLTALPWERGKKEA